MFHSVDTEKVAPHVAALFSCHVSHRVNWSRCLCLFRAVEELGLLADAKDYPLAELQEALRAHFAGAAAAEAADRR